jgi:hypothetical protein
MVKVLLVAMFAFVFLKSAQRYEKVFGGSWGIWQVGVL